MTQLSMKERVAGCSLSEVGNNRWLVRGGHCDSIGVIAKVAQDPDLYEAWRNQKRLGTYVRRSNAVRALVQADLREPW